MVFILLLPSKIARSTGPHLGGLFSPGRRTRADFLPARIEAVGAGSSSSCAGGLFLLKARRCRVG
jgi:hypothetical protein